MPDGTVRELDRQTKRELLWNRWADISPTSEPVAVSEQSTPEGNSATPNGSTIVEWKLDSNKEPQDEAVNSCGCW